MTITLESLDRTQREHAKKIADFDRRLAIQEEWAGKVLATLARLEASLTDLDLVRLEVVGLRTIVAQAMSTGATSRMSDRPISQHDFDKRMADFEERTNPGVIVATGVKLWAMRAGAWLAGRVGQRVAWCVGSVAAAIAWHVILAVTHHLR
jgi:hypothetical protein